jgi:hypothetical protein
MSFRGYKKKYGAAGWVSAFPEQVKRTKKEPKAKKPRKLIRRRNPKRASEEKKYRERVKVWLLGKECRKCHNPATQTHHAHGRRGRLLLWEPGWRPLCAECHDWAHKNPADGLRYDLFAQGTWNDFQRAWAYEQSMVTTGLRKALEAYQAHHEKGV